MPAVLKRPPTLSKLTGLSEQQLGSISSWLEHAESRGSHHADAQGGGGEAVRCASASRLRPASSMGPSRARDSFGLAAVASLPAPAVGTGSNSGKPLPPALWALAQSSPLSSAPGAAPPAGGQPVAASHEPTPPGASGMATISATAAAMYQDKRLGISCPCVVSVVVSVVLQRTPAAAAEQRHAILAQEAVLTAEASARARGAAERTARQVVDSIGQQRIEDCIAEVLVCSARAQRLKVRQQRQVSKEVAARRIAAAEAQPLIRRAVSAAMHSGHSSTGTSCKAALQLATVAAGLEAVVGPKALPVALTAHSRSSSAASSLSGAVEGASPTGSVAAAASPREGQSLSGAAASEGEGSRERVTLRNLRDLLDTAASGGGSRGAKEAVEGVAGRASSTSLSQLSERLSKRHLE